MNSSSNFLELTPSLDIEAPAILDAVARVTEGATGDVERAVRLHDFVRDEVLFGWLPSFDASTASQTLEAAIGFCNTKTPLFVAVLRAAGIPARMHFAGIDKRILRGLIDPIDR